MIGADVASLRALARSFDQNAAVLNQIVSRLSAALSNPRWHGVDANKFRSEWRSVYVPKLRASAEALHDASRLLQQHASEQERASAAGGGSSAGGQSGPLASPPWASIALGGIQAGLGLADLAGILGDVWDTPWFKGEKFIEWDKLLAHGSFLSAGLKGVGLGTSLADLVGALRDGDNAGAIGAGADAAFTFAAAPISLLWTGLKTEVGFFLPLDATAANEHYEWMEQRGFSGSDIAERYEGVQGFITYGNDNVERHAPWLNRAADKLMEKPAEWLYNIGIRL